MRLLRDEVGDDRTGCGKCRFALTQISFDENNSRNLISSLLDDLMPMQMGMSCFLLAQQWARSLINLTVWCALWSEWECALKNILKNISFRLFLLSIFLQWPTGCWSLLLSWHFTIKARAFRTYFMAIHCARRKRTPTKIRLLLYFGMRFAYTMPTNARNNFCAHVSGETSS